jgi:LPXTG-motif cell wall-anchored protein
MDTVTLIRVLAGILFVAIASVLVYRKKKLA